MAELVGMDVAAVRTVAAGMRTQAGVLAHAIGAVDHAINESLQIWSGQDSQDFSHTWHGSLRSQLDAARQALEEMARTASVNADEQDTASSPAGVGASAVGVAGGAGALSALASTIRGLDLNSHAEATASGLEVGPDGTTLGSASASAFLLDKGVQGAAVVGGVTVAGAASVAYGAQIAGSVGIDKTGLNAQAQAFAGWQGHAEGSATYGALATNASVDGRAGLSAGAKGHVGLDGASAHVDAMAGAEAEAKASASAGGVTGTGHVGGIVGIGVEGDAAATFQHGKLHVSLHGGAAVVIGGSIGGEIDVDPGEVARTGQELAGKIGHLFDR